MTKKRSFVHIFLKSKFQEKFIGYSPFTVKAEDIQKCSSQQAVELFKEIDAFRMQSLWHP